MEARYSITAHNNPRQRLVEKVVFYCWISSFIVECCHLSLHNVFFSWMSFLLMNVVAYSWKCLLLSLNIVFYRLKCMFYRWKSSFNGNCRLLYLNVVFYRWKYLVLSMNNIFYRWMSFFILDCRHVLSNVVFCRWLLSLFFKRHL